MHIRIAELRHTMYRERGSVQVACEHPGDPDLGEGKVSIGVFPDETVLVVFSDSSVNHDLILSLGFQQVEELTGEFEKVGGAYYRIMEDGEVRIFGRSFLLRSGIPPEVQSEVEAELNRLVGEYRKILVGK